MYSITGGESIVENVNISESTKALADAIKLLQPVILYQISTPPFTTSNCDEVNDAKKANGWNDHEYLPRMASCLKGDAKVRLNE